MKRLLFGVLGILISIFAIYYISKNISFVESWEQIQKIASGHIAILMLIYLCSFVPRAYRWQLMLKNYPNVKFEAFLKATLVGFAGNNFIPARGGELLRMEYFSRDTKISRVTALASVLTEKILDGLALLLFLILGVALSPIDVLKLSWLKNLLILAAALFLGALIAMLFLKMKHDFISRLLKNRNHNRFIKFLERLHDKIQSALTFLKLSNSTIQIVGASILIWLIEAAVFILALQFLEIEIHPLAAGFLMLSIVNFGILLPSSPAYLGVFQGMSILALTLFNIPQTTGLTVGVLVHFCQFVPVSLIGGIVLISRFFR